MRFLLLFYLIVEFLLLAIFGQSAQLDVCLILTNLNIIITLVTLCNYKKFKLPIVISYLIRCSFLYIDLYAKNIINLPNSGADTENFYITGLLYGRGADIINGNLYGGLYSKFLGCIFRAVGNQRLFVQYINVVLSISTILILIDILERLDINYKLQEKVIWIISIFPMNIILSSILLRESIIVYLVTLAILYYVIYINNSRNLYLIFSVLLVVLASMFHSGMIIFILGLMYYQIFTRNKNTGIFGKFVMILITLVILILLKDKIFSKFIVQKALLESNDNYITEAGSRYLPNIYINSFDKVIKFGWLKTIYFLISPTPMYWRGAGDVMTFVLDSMIYVYLSYKIFSNKTKNESHNINILYKSILLGLVLTAFVFGIGTSAAGTAMRHRNKLITIFLILFSISENYKVDLISDRKL